MSRHRKREQRKRHAKWRRKLAAFGEIIARGGMLVCAPDVYAALMAGSTEIGLPFRDGVELRSSPYAPPGTLYAIQKQHAWPDGAYRYSPFTESGPTGDTTSPHGGA